MTIVSTSGVEIYDNASLADQLIKEEMLKTINVANMLRRMM